MDTIFYNGLIRSMDEEGTCYEAIGITGDKISFLGSNEEAAALERKKKEEARKAGDTDYLTGLLSRMKGEDRISAAMLDANGGCFAFIELDAGATVEGYRSGCAV